MARYRLRFACFLLYSLPAFGIADTISVMVVFDETAWNNTSPTTRQADADLIIAHANAGLANTGYAGFHSFQLANANVNEMAPMPHRSDLAPGESILLGVTYANTSSQRDNTYHADLIILVSEFLVKSSDPSLLICGAADAPGEFPVLASHAETNYAAVVKRSCIEPAYSDFGRVAIHELGHLLSAQHETGNLPGQDTNATAPVTYNHPTMLGNLATIMVTGLGNCPAQPCSAYLSFSNPQANFPGTSLPSGHAYDRDNKRMIDEAFPVIARYRAPPVQSAGPDRPICFIEFVRCNAGRKEWIVSWEHNGQAQPFAVFDVDYTYNASGGWSNFFDGDAICAPTTPSTNSTIIFRARVSTSYGLSPYCQVSILGANCTGEHGD